MLNKLLITLAASAATSFALAAPIVTETPTSYIKRDSIGPNGSYSIEAGVGGTTGERSGESASALVGYSEQFKFASSMVDVSNDSGDLFGAAVARSNLSYRVNVVQESDMLPDNIPLLINYNLNTAGYFFIDVAVYSKASVAYSSDSGESGLEESFFELPTTSFAETISSSARVEVDRYVDIQLVALNEVFSHHGGTDLADRIHMESDASASIVIDPTYEFADLFSLSFTPYLGLETAQAKAGVIDAEEVPAPATLALMLPLVAGVLSRRRDKKLS